jgi:hypothetical protein
MDSNTHSVATPDRLATLEAEVDRLAAQDLDRLTDAARAERVLRLRRLLDRLEGQWLGELAAVDGRGATGAEEGLPAPLHRQLAAQPPAPERQHRHHPGPHRPGPVPRPPHRHRPGPD